MQVINKFDGITLEETRINVGTMLIPWKNLGILTSIGCSLKLSQILNLEQVIELYVYASLHKYSKGNEKVMKRVWLNFGSAKTFVDYDRNTSDHKRNYTGSGITEAAGLLLSGKEVYCFIDFAYRVNFYTKSQFILMMLGNPRRFLGAYGVWINLNTVFIEYAGITFIRNNAGDFILKQFKKIYDNIAKGLDVVFSKRNPSLEKIIELIKEPNSELIIRTNNLGSVTSVVQSKITNQNKVTKTGENSD